MRTAIAIAACLAATAVKAQTSSTVGASPFFSDYPAAVHAGPRGSLKLIGDAVSYRTRIRNEAGSEPNFAGEYRLVTWGCGATCLTGALIHIPTGEARLLPFSVCCSNTPTAPMEFHAGSRLLKANGLLNEDEARGFGPHFFVMSASGLAPVSTRGDSAPTQTETASPALPPADFAGEEPPKVDVDRTCEERFSKSRAAQGECVRREQLSYDLVRSMWLESSPEDRVRCASTSVRQPMWNYTYMQACLMQALEMARLRTVPKFRP